MGNIYIISYNSITLCAISYPSKEADIIETSRYLIRFLKRALVVHNSRPRVFKKSFCWISSELMRSRLWEKEARQMEKPVLLTYGNTHRWASLLLN